MGRIRRIISTAALSLLLSFVSCGNKKDSSGDRGVAGHIDLEYAKQYSIDICEGGAYIIHIADDDYVYLPENAELPENTENMQIIRQPADNIYVAASSAMDLFYSTGSIGSVYFTSTKQSDWGLPYIRELIDNGDIFYAGKYSAPDYEMLLEGECGLAVESTMIYHAPEIKEQLEALGIPVIVERSSYETDPLGRMEWIKLYGLITGHLKEAEDFFNEQNERVKSVSEKTQADPETRTVAFFSINPNGYVTIHKPGDYVCRMIEMAGGKYIFTPESLDTEENSLSTMNLQWENFYETAKNADVIIYNSTIEGELETLDQLISKNSLLTDFKAVQNGEVWCTGKNMFQQTSGAADMICDINNILTDSTENTEYLRRLE